MRAALFVPVFAAAAFAQSSSDDFPQTSYLQQTNSLGVVTGQPAVATSIPSQPPADTSIPSQPAVETSIPAVATSVGVVASIPAVSPGVQTVPVQGTAGVNSTQTIIVSANNSTTIVLSTIGVKPSGNGASGSGSTPTGTGSEASATGGDASGSGTGTAGPESTGAAATMRAVAGSVVGVGAFMAAFL